MKQMVARILLVSFGLGLGLLVCELALPFLLPASKGTEFNSIADIRRAMLSPNTETSPELGNNSLKALVDPNPNDRIIYQLKPNLNLKFMRTDVRTNSCGMRDIERAIAKAPDVYRIALLGDSFAFGWGVEQDQTFAKVLERALNRLSDGVRKFEVLNFGVPGYSTFQEVALFKELALQFSPDEVLVYMVDNDFGLPFFVRNVGDEGGMLSATQFAQLAIKAIDPKIMEHKAELMRWDPNHSLLDLDKLAKENGMRVSVVINPGKSSRKVWDQLWALRDNSSKGMRKISLRNQILDVIKRRQIDPKDLTLSFDPHPSPLKHEILGELLASYFMDRLP